MTTVKVSSEMDVSHILQQTDEEHASVLILSKINKPAVVLMLRDVLDWAEGSCVSPWEWGVFRGVEAVTESAEGFHVKWAEKGADAVWWHFVAPRGEGDRQYAMSFLETVATQAEIGIKIMERSLAWVRA